MMTFSTVQNQWTDLKTSRIHVPNAPPTCFTAHTHFPIAAYHAHILWGRRCEPTPLNATTIGNVYT